MGEDAVPQCSVGKPGHHGDLEHGHDLPALDAGISAVEQVGSQDSKIVVGDMGEGGTPFTSPIA